MTNRLLVVLGGILVVTGIVGAVALGPDNRIVSGPHALDHRGVAVVTSPGVVSWADLELEVLAEVPDEKPILVGLANSVDLESYLATVGRLEVTDVSSVPNWDLSTRTLTGAQYLPGSPVSADWWIASEAGLGAARVATTLPDETVSLAVLAVGDATLEGLEVSVAWGVEGIFARAVGLALIGAGLVAWGLRRRSA